MNCLFFISYLLINILPPLNNIYKGNINLPLLGKQRFNYERIENNKSCLKLSGVIKTSGYIYYDINNLENYELDSNLKNIVNKYKCSINQPYYDCKKDVVIFILNINLLRVTKNIELVNINKEDDKR